MGVLKSWVAEAQLEGTLELLSDLMARKLRARILIYILKKTDITRRCLKSTYFKCDAAMMLF